MNRWFVKLLWALGLAIAIALVGVLLLCWHFGVWSYQDWDTYQNMSHECHPVWRDLHSGRIKPGDEVAPVIRRTHPDKVETFEDVQWLHYGGGFTGVTITAKEGRVVNAGAWSCTWQRPFFDSWSGPEREAFENRYTAHLRARWQAQQGP